MGFLYAHTLTTTFLIALVGFAVGGAAISGNPLKRAPRAPDGSTEGGWDA